MTYVVEQAWKCVFCEAETSFKYAGSNPRFCSNVCRFRFRDEERLIERLRREKNGGSQPQRRKS